MISVPWKQNISLDLETYSIESSWIRADWSIMVTVTIKSTQSGVASLQRLNREYKLIRWWRGDVLREACEYEKSKEILLGEVDRTKRLDASEIGGEANSDDEGDGVGVISLSKWKVLMMHPRVGNWKWHVKEGEMIVLVRVVGERKWSESVRILVSQANSSLGASSSVPEIMICIIWYLEQISHV